MLWHDFARAQHDQFYPHGALSNVYFQEKTEQMRAEQLEREAIRKRDDYEEQKRNVEQKIASHKFQIEELKNRQARAQEEIAMVSANLEHVKGQIATYDAEHKKMDDQAKVALQELETQRADLSEKQKQLEQLIFDLADDRKRAEREIYVKSMETQRLRAEVARLNTKITAAETKRAELEADEMKARTDWMQIKLINAELIKEQDHAVAELEDAKKRWNLAQKELADAKATLARSQRNRDQAVAQMKTDLSRFEKEILAANRSKIAAEAEQIRLNAESEKIKEYVDRIRETRDLAVDQEKESSGMVLRTKVAVETARTDLTENVEAADRAALVSAKEKFRRRGLASAAEAAELVDGGRMWITSKQCKAYPEPSTAAPAVGYFEAGRKLLGKDRNGGWIEISNGTGKSVFVDGRCGAYEN